MSLGILLIVFLALLVIYTWSLYNQFVTSKTRIKASVQEIGNQLKRQAQLIPNIISMAKGYLKHEKEIFAQLTEARKQVLKVLSSADAEKLMAASEQMQKALSPIHAVFESTPQLQSAGPWMKAMDELRDTADKLMYARRTLIDLSADYNVKVATFPSKLVAQLFHFEPEAGLKTPAEGAHLEVSETETSNPKI
jgi:LemA protein